PHALSRPRHRPRIGAHHRRRPRADGARASAVQARPHIRGVRRHPRLQAPGQGALAEVRAGRGGAPAGRTQCGGRRRRWRERPQASDPPAGKPARRQRQRVSRRLPPLERRAHARGEAWMTDPGLENAAARVLELVADGMRVGLGTGHAAAVFLARLADRIRGGLHVVGVATSEATAAQARSLGIPLGTLDDDPEELALTVDGADEVAPNLDLVKGFGGALVRERIVAAASRRQVILVGHDKLVGQLGMRRRIPIEVVPFACRLVLRRVRALGLEGVMRHGVEVVPDKRALMEAGAAAFAAAARAAIAAHGRFVTALSGGSTPRALFELLATERFAASIDWSRIHVCWGDERAVPPDADASNYRMAREALLDHVPIPPSQVHRIRGEEPPMIAAAAYER